MEYVSLGRTGLKVSRIGLGCMTFGSPDWAPWVLDAEASAPIISAAVERGINLFDTADMYSRGASEEILREKLLPLVPRHKLVLATKLFNPMSDDANDRGLSRKHVFDSIDGSLRRLGTDYVDLLQIHRFDYETPLEETLEALSDVVRMGKVRYLGASSMFAWQFMKALGIQRANGWAPFVSMQPHYNLIYREEEREMLPLCISEGIGVLPWSPLARGMLAGKHSSVRSGSDGQLDRLYGDSREADAHIVDAVSQVAAERGVAMAVVAYAWVMNRPGITAPLVGISRPELLDDVMAALEIKLSEGELERLEKPYRTKPVAGHS